MNIGSIFFNLIIRPIEILFEVIFDLVYSNTSNIFISLIILSLTVNILVLPLYYRADIIQRSEANKKKHISHWEKHIKKSFKGDEQFMMLQTYYRQNNYKPYQTINNILPLFLEIPFFIGAYHFLSNLNVVDGISLWNIKDLNLPDNLFSIGGYSINFLPILMTLVNIISIELYSIDLGKKNKLQMYTIALVFLCLLYNSSSCLCIYWTLNNIFSLIKNIIYIIYDKGCKNHSIYNRNSDFSKAESLIYKNDYFLLYFISSVFMSLFVGAYIPSHIISSSPEDFFDKSMSNNPCFIIFTNFIVCCGIFIFWGFVIYYLFSKKIRYYLLELLIIFSFCSILIYSISDNYGRMNKFYIYEHFQVNNSFLHLIQTFVILIGIIVLVHLMIKKWYKILDYVLLTGVCVLLVIIGCNIKDINTSYQNKKNIIDKYSDNTEIHLSKNGKNVVVIMMDRMISQYIPYFLNEKPELEDSFSGFTYYPNSISFGTATNTGSPGLYGGYEYIPQESDKRKNILLKDKQNEALKVMPVLFYNNGYNVRVSDPTYADYNWIPDLRIYNDYSEIVSSISMGRIRSNSELYNGFEISRRNVFFNSINYISPFFIKEFLYDGGNYFNPEINYGISYQSLVDKHFAYGISEEFYDSYSILYNMDKLTVVDDDNTNNFFMMSNDTTHDPCLLQEPTYDVSMVVDNSSYDYDNSVREDIFGNEISIFSDGENDSSNSNTKDYCSNMAALIKLGEWFDYLKNVGVYDNTRIIIVSDHSADEYLDERFKCILKSNDEDVFVTDLMRFQCTLLVKDFNSDGFSIDDTFMTNADVPSLAIEGIIQNKKNPLTGNDISMDYKYNNELQLSYTDNISIETNNGYTFLPEHKFSVKDNIFDINNWKYLGYY